MDKLIKVRHYYQMAQDEVAAYLGISRSRIAMCENNKRAFPDEANERLRLLNYCWDNNQNTESQFMLKVVIESIKQQSTLFYKERLAECELHLKALQKQRNDVEKEFEACQNRYRAYITIESRLKEAGQLNGEIDTSWFFYNRGKAQKGIVTLGKELFSIDYQISNLELELERLKGLDPS